MKNWKHEEFITYLYMLAVDADFNTTSEEMALAEVKTTKIMRQYFTGFNYSFLTNVENIKATSAEDKKISQTEMKKIVKGLNFSDELKSEIISDLGDIVSSDESVTQEEHNFVKFVKIIFL